MLCVAGCAAPEKSVRVGGEEGTLSGIIVPVKETYEEDCGITLNIVKSRPGLELVDLEKGSVEMIVAMQPLQQLIQEAAREKVVLKPESLRQFEVGKTSTVVFLHKKNRVRKLTKKQIKSIFTGKIRNWKQLGGANREIVLVWNNVAQAENDIFVKELLEGAPLGGKTLLAENFEEVRAKVMSTPGAIGIAPYGFKAPGVKIPNSPAIDSSVIAVTMGEPTPGTKKLIELLKDAAFIQ
jgi:phosphate transport system substrate-binding protein